MLQIKNLTKKYKPKKGVPVLALDSVSLCFPEKGMVFLLGKSGSGKSTLLNLLGGLDTFDSGEILIAGKSAGRFRQKDFDSYRNTLVGFVFQEYNVLEEFTVGANIALALELQGKKATDRAISDILEQVDLAGYGARRPNELSGGQLQRIAIARALVKNPKIIMADEPTGALDSATGRQILDTLKKLSEEKLVIVVSHDREFAELYADRIIELSDGKVLSDREFVSETPAFSEEGIFYGEHEISISAGYTLTEEDRLQINEYLKEMQKGGKLGLKFLQKRGRTSRATVEEQNSFSSGKIDFIASKLPLKAAFRIGAGALKHKKIRLAFTILLSCIAFGLFGLADTFGAYDRVKTCVQSILDSGISYASVVRAEKISYEGNKDYYFVESGRIREEKLAGIQKESGVSMYGVVLPHEMNLDFSHHYDRDAEFTKSEYHIYPYALNGFASLSEAELAEMNMPLLAGRMPKGEKNEIAVTSYFCETFFIGGFAQTDAEGKTTYQKIEKPEDLLGKKIRFEKEEFEIVGVVASGFDLERYRPLTEENLDEDTADQIVSFALYSELMKIRYYSFAQVGFVSREVLDRLASVQPEFYPLSDGSFSVEWNSKEENEYFGFWPQSLGTLDMANGREILWLSEEKEALSENEIVVSLPLLFNQTGVFLEHPIYDEEGSLDLSSLTDSDREKIVSLISEIPDLRIFSHRYGTIKSLENGKIAGVLLCRSEEVILAEEGMVQAAVRTEDGIYEYAVGKMPNDREGIEKLVKFSYDESGKVRYKLQNSVCFELDSIHEVLVFLSDVFLYVGIGFAVFASLMLSNFIGTSIAYKKHEIGILRAIGARSSDVFRIFFSESFLIAMINFVLSSLGTLAAVLVINAVIRTKTGILVTVLVFSFRQILLLFAASVFVAAVASFLPVKKIASKKPIDAIRGR